MGMVMCLTAVSAENLQRLQAYPPLLWQLLAPGDEEAYQEARRAEGPGFFKRLLGRAEPAPEPAPLQLQDGEGESTDLDKAWHGIHYLLTHTEGGGEWPAGFLLAGGQDIGRLDVGYGPARGLTAEEVAALAQYLATRDEAWLRSRFDAADMMRLNIYPPIWQRESSEDDVLGYCLEYFAELKRFVQQQADRGWGILLYLS